MIDETDGVNEPSPTTASVLFELLGGARDHDKAAAARSKTRPRANADANARGCAGTGLSPTGESGVLVDNPDGITRRFFAPIPSNGYLLQGLRQLLGRTSIDEDDQDIEFQRYEVDRQQWAEARFTLSGYLRLDDLDSAAWINSDTFQEVRR